MGSPLQAYFGGSHLLILYLLPSLLALSAAGHCEVSKCSHTIKQDQISPGPSYHFCALLQTYDRCIQATAKGCRGHLEYHTVSSLIGSWRIKYNCTEIIARGPRKEDSTTPPFPHYRQHRMRPAANPECSYREKHHLTPVNFSHCALFGDPHLRTFYNEFQTCKLEGAWPLIDNPLLAVQVTNQPVVTAGSATATTKITVVIRKHLNCTDEKVYEAQAEDLLSSTFVDGTRSNGPDRGVRIKEEDPGHHIEIHARHLAARIVIRKVGRYLTFAIRLPREVAYLGGVDSLELCGKGCPHQEQIDFVQMLSETSLEKGGEQWIPVLARKGKSIIPIKDCVSICRQHNVTGIYYEACLFDLLTTGDVSFSEAARDALKDVLNLYPALSHNRTSFRPPSKKPQLLEVIDNSGPGRPCFSLMIWVLPFISFTMMWGALGT